MESPKVGIVIKENPLYDNFDSISSKSKREAHPNVMSVMMADVMVEQKQTRETAESSQILVAKAGDKGKNVVQENQPQQQSASVASLSIQQLQYMITNSIRAQYRGPPPTSFMYFKSYTKRINNLRIPLGYQPLKF
ncbi:ty3-gypsy retrotransposon protein [Cucumis melo var. makuwa]|uniref:Ty3-gypsy retrotransposon protein n=1 Tax=Cucumis melo var. makuwa TaxID=1194695 RepID=A0A5D3BTZ0_CUCMM|nr:ty3-gypsy retrotransposon protein [Cucumis melo var. makuwa]TYK03191.1 ty3-gypsy retrotransposon protein [Cucumis melo var. makuwa]